jgi:transcriptional regulator with XRE-family HTH domain
MLSKRIKLLREEHGLSQVKLGQILNVSQQAIGKWEKGIAEPNSETIRAMADYFDVSSDFLLGKSNIRNPFEAADKISDALGEDEELFEFWETLRQREDLKLLFKQTKDLKPKDIQQIIRIIKAIEDEEEKEW